MVNFNPRLSQALGKVFSSKNIQLELHNILLSLYSEIISQHKMQQYIEIKVKYKNGTKF